MQEPTSISVMHCEGWWEQRVLGRQDMQELELFFHHGRVAGSGVDCIGSFILSGDIDESGHVSLLKRYVHQHDVEYFGYYDGEGTLQGEWLLGADHGRWLIKLKRPAAVTSSHISEWMPTK